MERHILRGGEGRREVAGFQRVGGGRDAVGEDQ